MAGNIKGGGSDGGLDVPGELVKVQGFGEVARANALLQGNVSPALRSMALELRGDGYVLESARMGISGLRKSADTAQTRAVEGMRMLLPRLQRQLETEEAAQQPSHFASGRSNTQNTSVRNKLSPVLTAGKDLASYTQNIVQTDLRTP